MRAAVKYETVEGWQHERSPSVEMISEMKPPRSLDRCAHVRCQEPCSGVAEWVQCEACTKWYHDICVFKGPTSPKGEPWFCSACMADGLEHCQKLMELNKRNNGGNQAQEQGGSSGQHVQQQQPSSSAVAGPSRDRRLSSASTASFKTQTSGSRANGNGVDHPQPTSPASPPLLLLAGPNSPSPSSANVVKQEQNMAAAVPMPANGEKAVVHIQLLGGPDGLAMDRLERYHFNGQQGISIGAMLQWAIYRIRTVALAEQNVELPPNWGEGDLLQVQINDRELGKLCHTLVTDPVEPLTEYLVGYAASGGGEEAGTGQPKPTGTSSEQRNSKVPAPKKLVTGTKSRVQAALKRVKSGRVEKEKQTARPKTEPKQKKKPAKAKSGAGKKRAPPPQSKKVPLTPNWSQCQPSTSTSFSSPSSPNSKVEPPMPNISSGGRLRKPVDRYIAPVWTARK